MCDGKGTLALGNLTGAVVFQSAAPVTFGVLFTSWELGPLNLFSAAFHSWHLMVGGVFYLAFLIAAVSAII